MSAASPLVFQKRSSAVIEEIKRSTLTFTPAILSEAVSTRPSTYIHIKPAESESNSENESQEDNDDDIENNNNQNLNLINTTEFSAKSASTNTLKLAFPDTNTTNKRGYQSNESDDDLKLDISQFERRKKTVKKPKSKSKSPEDDDPSSGYNSSEFEDAIDFPTTNTKVKSISKQKNKSSNGVIRAPLALKPDVETNDATSEVDSSDNSEDEDYDDFNEDNDSGSSDSDPESESDPIDDSNTSYEDNDEDDDDVNDNNDNLPKKKQQDQLTIKINGHTKEQQPFVSSSESDNNNISTEEPNQLKSKTPSPNLLDITVDNFQYTTQKESLAGRVRREDEYIHLINKKYTFTEPNSDPKDKGSYPETSRILKVFPKGMRPPKGLVNTGVTCYMNSAIQALFHIPGMAQYLTKVNKGVYKDVISPKSVTRDLAFLFHRMTDESFHKKTILPSAIIRRLDDINPLMSQWNQEDAHEYFMSLIGRLQEDSVPKGQKLNSSILHEMFGGTFLQTVVCQECHNKSDTHQDFFDIQVSIDKHELKVTGKATLRGSIRQYFDTSLIKKSKSEGYDCEKCKKKTNASTRQRIEKAPEYLIVSIKRYEYTNKHTSQKLKQHLSIAPVIELAQYAVNEEPMRYQLLAFAVHEGRSASSGHYLAYCLQPDNSWAQYDDDFIHPLPAQRVYRCKDDIYFLVYTRVRATLRDDASPLPANILSPPLPSHDKNIKSKNNEKHDSFSLFKKSPKAKRDKTTPNSPHNSKSSLTSQNSHDRNSESASSVDSSAPSSSTSSSLSSSGKLAKSVALLSTGADFESLDSFTSSLSKDNAESSSSGSSKKTKAHKLRSRLSNSGLRLSSMQPTNTLKKTKSAPGGLNVAFKSGSNNIGSDGDSDGNTENKLTTSVSASPVTTSSPGSKENKGKSARSTFARLADKFRSSKDKERKRLSSQRSSTSLRSQTTGGDEEMGNEVPLASFIPDSVSSSPSSTLSKQSPTTTTTSSSSSSSPNTHTKNNKYGSQKKRKLDSEIDKIFGPMRKQH